MGGMNLQSFLVRLIAWCLLPLLLLGGWLAVRHVQLIRTEQVHHAAQFTHNAVTVLDQFLRARLGTLQVLTETLQPLATTGRTGPDERSGRSVRDDASEVPVYLVISDVLATSGVSTVGSNHLSAGPLATRPWPVPELPARALEVVRMAVASQRPGVGVPYLDPATRASLVPLVAPCVQQDRVTCVLVTLVPLREIDKRLAMLARPGSWVLRLLDREGRILADGDPPETGEAAAGYLALDHAGLAPWSVGVKTADDERLSVITRTALVMLLAMAGATAVSILGGRWAAARLADSVASLADSHEPDSASLEIREVSAAWSRLERADLAVQLRDAQLRAIFDSASEAIIVIAPSQRIVMANTAATCMFGRPLEMLVGAPLGELIPERFRQRHEVYVQAFGATDAIPRTMGRRSDITGLRADGEEFPIEVAISHVHVDGQHFSTAIVRDITERRKDELALHESRAKLAVAMDSMNDAVFISDAYGNVSDVNAAFAAFHRFSNKSECPRTLAEYQGQFDVCFADGSLAPLQQWAVPRALSGETASSVEYRLRRKDTGEQWIGSYSFAPIRDSRGYIVGSITTARDITLLKKVQAELEASHADLQHLVAVQDSVQEMERARVARDLHDDLQQTLAAVLMEITAMRCGSEVIGPRTHEALDRLDVLAATAIASTRRIIQDLRPQMLDEFGLLPALRHLAVQFTERTGVACDVDDAELAPGAEARLAPVATCLYRVAQEALNNVAKHSGARSVQLRLASLPPGGLTMSITDDGSGMPSAQPLRAGAFGLLGMGERVRAAGGHLDVRSQPGVGTTVEVCLERITAAPEIAVA